MNGGKFLISLRKAIFSEQILLMRSLLKENINNREKELKSCTYHVGFDWLKSKTDENDVSIEKAKLSQDSCAIVYVIVDYV